MHSGFAGLAATYAAGYVRRAPDPSDRRKTMLELVPGRIASLRMLYGSTDQDFDALSRQFTHDEMDAVFRYLDAVSSFHQLGSA